MSTRRAALVIPCVGLVVFGLVFTLLEFSHSLAAPAEPAPTEVPVATALPGLASDSLAAKLRDGMLAVGVPIAGSEVLLRDVQPGDRLDVLASLSALGGGQPVTAVVVRGATVLRPSTSTEPLLLEVSGSDAITLAHVVLSGTHLGFVLWAANASPDSRQTPLLDGDTTREWLGLNRPTATVVASPTNEAHVATATPTPTPATRTDSGFLYQVQAGDSWDSIAGIFGIPVSQLRGWNEASTETDPVPGRLVFIPRPS